jgi:hypothetical protein
MRYCVWEIRSMDDSATTDEDSSLQDGESVGRSSKKPSTSGNIMHLKNSMRVITGKNSLKFNSKKSWVEVEIGRTLDSIQSYMEETQTEKLHKGDFMRKHQKLIMWLILMILAYLGQTPEVPMTDFRAKHHSKFSIATLIIQYNGSTMSINSATTSSLVISYT